MKAMILLVPMLVLSSLVFPQSSTSIPPRVLRTAEIINARTTLEELASLRQRPTPDSQLRELRLVQNLQGTVLAASLDVESVKARIDYETARLNEVGFYLRARRDKRASLNNWANLLIGSGIGAVGSGMQLGGPSTQHAGNIVSTAAGAGATLFSIVGIQQQRGSVRAPGYSPGMLAAIFGRTPPEGSSYPEDVWKYLTTPDPALPRGVTGQQHLLSEWKMLGRLGSNGQSEVSQLTSTGKHGVPVSIGTVEDRTAMLADVRSHVTSLEVDLAELMRFVVAGMN